MKWEKKGLIYGPDGSSSWAKHSALQPTPIILNASVIRVFVGFRDNKGVGRVGFIDVATDNPSKVLKVSKNPALEIGSPGTFDENGVIPCAVVRRENSLYLYYAGYQLGYKVRFFVYSGLAISNDEGESFQRIQKTPITDRSDEGLFFRVIHSIIHEKGKWKVWYGAGSKFIKGKKKTLPVYNIRYMESDDGISFPQKGIVVIDIDRDEHRLGRPYVIKDGNIFKMFYGIGTKKIPYKLGYSESADGVKWKRKDNIVGLTFSINDWDSKMIAYPAVVTTKNNRFIFYNGNNYGREGFGYAVLSEGHLLTSR